jgi:hypothetical protein
MPERSTGSTGLSVPVQTFQQTRHARRIYIGGFPAEYAEEKALSQFLDDTIAKGLGEPVGYAYVLSTYVNTVKCFAFVELRSMEVCVYVCMCVTYPLRPQPRPPPLPSPLSD